jgi:threonine/homoserine/homoserine lactone efflux protein
MSAPLGSLVVATIGLVIGFPCISVWALFGVAIRGYLTEPRKQRAFNLLMAGTLLVLAVMFLR